ncbi:hypothetical protein ACROYT_G007881 [Oculina patagonica]
MDDTEESTEDTGMESFSLEDDQNTEAELNGNQRTSTPTKNITYFEDGMEIADGQLLNQGAVLSPVLNSGAETNTLTQDHQSSPPDQTFLSIRENSTQENFSDESQSLYTSALSNVNATVTSDSGGLIAEGTSEEPSMLEDSFQVTLHQESLGRSSTKDSTWETAYGSFHEDSDLKDVTIKEEHGESNLSEVLQDETVDDSNYEDNSVIRSGEEPHDVSESTYQGMASTFEDDQDLHQWRNGVTEHNETSDRSMNSEGINSPDLDLLNEICEEATNMTIKEALICSLNPGVRAGLREGRLSLNESEILALEQYCEKFIDNLISQLLSGQWSDSINDEACKQKPHESKAKVAKKLSNLGLETLKTNCDRFVHSIITESLHDSCFGFQHNETKLPDGNKESDAKQKQNVLDQKSIQDVLPILKDSDAIQDYIGFLAADIVKSALANLSTSIATKHGEKNEPMKLNNNSTSQNRTEIQEKSCSLKDKQEVQCINTNNDMWKSHGTSGGGIENGTNRGIASVGSDDDFEIQYVRDIEELSEDEQIFSSSLTGALETSLEFDHEVGEWEGGGLLADLHSLETDKKQKIVLRELSFDEHAEVAGTELLAPVFLAIAEENDDDSEFQGMRKKAQSIEDLCPVIDEDENPRQRSYSAPKKFKPIPQPVHTDFKPEEENSEDSETELNEEEYEGDEESEIGDEDEEDDNDQVVEGEEDKQEPDVKAQLEAGSGGDRFRWHTVSVKGRDKILDLKLLEPYMKVVSHGGYFSDTKATIVVIAACYLPERSTKNYDFLMEQLFFYVISTLELLAIHEEYYLVYLNGGTRQQNMPSVTWMKRFYQYIEGGLKKRMREMFIVHPNFRLKAVITLAKPLINASFWRKLSFVHSLSSLSSHVPVDYIYIPDEVMRADPTYRQVHNR